MEEQVGGSGMEEQGVFPIVQVARLIRGFSREQKLLLLRLVPELQTLRTQGLALSVAEETDTPESGDIPEEQAALMRYFDQKFEALPARRPLSEDAAFLGGLTVAEFFAAPEAEQERLWREAHAEAVRVLRDEVHDVRGDALPA